MEKILKEIKSNIGMMKSDLNTIEETAKVILDCAKRKEFISEDITKTMISSLNNHLKLKDICDSLYATIGDSNNTVTTIIEFEKKVEEIEKNSVRNMTAMFYDLHSDDEAIEKLLSDEKKKLDKIFADSFDEDDIESLVVDYIEFANAVNTINTANPSEILSTMQKMMRTFGSDLPMHAFVAKDIYVGSKNQASVKDNSELEKEGKLEGIQECEEHLNEPETEQDEEKAESELEKIVKKNDAIIPEDYDFGIVSLEVSPKEEKKIGAKEFKNDIKASINPKLTVQVLKKIVDENCVNELGLQNQFKEECISATLYYLINKGYLRKYNVVGKGEFYCSSKRLNKALVSKEVQSSLHIRGYSDDGDVYLEDKASFAMCRLGYSDIRQKRMSFKEIDEYSATLAQMSELSAVSLVVNKKYNDLLVCCNWTNCDEIGVFEEVLHDYFEKVGTPDHLVVSSVDKEYAKRLAISFAELMDYDVGKVLLRAYEDDCMVKLTDESIVEFADLWKEMVEENESETVENTVDEVSEEVCATEEKFVKEVQELQESAQNETEELVEEKILLEETVENTASVVVKDSVENIVAEEKVDVTQVMQNAITMINDEKLYCALSYLCANSKNNNEVYNIWRSFAYATNDPIKACRYSSTKMYDVYLSESSVLHDYLFVAATLRTFFYNHVEYDYLMKQLYDSNINNLAIVNQSKELKNAFRTLVLFKENVHKGINEYADYRMQDNVNLEKNIAKVKRRAKQFYDERIVGQIKENAAQRRFVETKKLIFDKEHDIAQYLQVVINGDKELYSVMKDYICDTFMKEDSEADLVNVDTIKLDSFMDEAWKNAGKNMRNMVKTSDLMSSLRRNLKNIILNAIEIMCDCLSYSSRFISGDDDEGLQRYKKERDGLIADLSAAKTHFDNSIQSMEGEEKAGCVVLIQTLDELIRRIDGSFSKNEYKYFYIDFLRADRVLLDKKFIPVMDMNFKIPKGLGIAERIFDHSTMTLGSFEERLEEIFAMHGDDFGSAELIIEYLSSFGNKLVEQNNYDIEESIIYGKRGAQKTKQAFIEDLELMQSYGQIDNTVENKKDIFMQIANNTYDFCYENNNFGFYRSVTEAIIAQIKEDSKKFKDSLVKELADFRNKISEQIDSEAILERLDEVQNVLDEQNYTVAQDLLSRIKKGDIETDIEILPMDYLADFIESYDNNVARTANSSKSLIDLISYKLKKPQNKDTNGGRKLINNWPMAGHSLDAEKLRALLQSLGFNVDMVEKDNKIGKIDNYKIKLTKPENGRKMNYKHPISAFGSIASYDDFRVAFLPGKTDADRLIMAMKELGNAKHTILIVDYAIALPDRRKLARKIKELNPTKVFGIIDRVMIMYLAENYNESYINQMLMSIMIPFSYVQPYVWDSGNVMPPEIFMGRDKELKDIESPTGINIVYGGRQLGKSALLKMARNDINYDENGRRAVYVDIKGKNFADSAHKIGQALYDEKVLDKDFDGHNWDDLAREIKRRLSDESRPIPYLLLLLDEADAFIESCEEVNFSPFDALKDIQNIGTGRFKFVIAGLRNIVKFTKSALANNSVLTHLGHTTITPFDYSEARELLEKPLYYLGLRFPKDNEALISLIFANANYFPGLIQLYCAKLVEAMTKGDYADYDENDAPIYTVTQEHIKKVLAEDGFLQQVREKFEITLKLDEDNYYYIIALLLAMLYHELGYSSGYSASDILTEGQAYGIDKIEDAGLDKIKVYMEELCELNVLRKLADDKYVFNRYNFFQMMGSCHEIEDKLMECMED